ncbi:DUF4294 domain-containing protein [Hydrotalea sp.]|uniref:DUF4294 domain-containing protein n=1 Tax=Hydrotalea sp. TaxID=2881279 RepID=UPI0025907504|nr:DUF4294 domain-containing protein [Hydrotalea sp.]
MVKRILHMIVIVCLCLIARQSHAQHSIYDTIPVHAFITPEGDTIPMGYLPDVSILYRLNARQKRYWTEWTRLRNAVYVTYPYAKAAGRIMNEINARLADVTNKSERRKIIRSREKELRKEFTDKLTQLSIYQGKILMKLIYRETGNNCYEIIQEYKGSLTATVYQTVAFFFGTSLKQNYDPNGNDRDIETIVRDLERMYGMRG